MSLEQFSRQRRPAWTRLAELVNAIYARGPRRISGPDINELLVLYRDVSADLAHLRAAGADPNLVDEINRIISRAHAQIYRGSRKSRVSMLNFLLRDYPRLFRRTWRFTFASLLISASFALMAYFTVQQRPDVVADILGGGDSEFRGPRSGEDIRSRFQHAGAAEITSMVTTNNINVALTAFALGITFGIGTVYILIVNGAMLGGFAGAYAHSGAGGDFWMTVLTHGALELSAIVIAGGAGLLVGYSLWCPGRRTRRRALREAAADACKLAIGLVPAFMVAGFFEGFVTPRQDLPAVLKVSLGIFVMFVYWMYLLFAGRTPAAASVTAGEGTATKSAGGS